MTVNNGPTIVPVVNVSPVTISVTSVSGTTATLNTQTTELDVVSSVGRQGLPGAAGQAGQDLTRREVRSATTLEYSYIGVAPTGSLESDAVWSIGRISLTGTIVMTNATNVAWTNRANGVYV